MKNWKIEDKIPFILNAFLIIFILIAICISLKVYLVGRSLWLDEAALAYSFSKRSLSNLTSDIFSWNQSAPVVYLYIVKIITEIFGNTELTLRIWSLITYIMLLGGIYYLSKYELNLKYPLFPTAFIANLSIFIYYASEFKPYMNDCLCVILAIIIYRLYNHKKEKRKKKDKYIVLAIFVFLVWTSNPCCFFIGSILIVEFIDGIINKDYSKSRDSIVAGIIIFISFVLYYFYWLKPVIDSGLMTTYWEFKKLFVPTSIQDIYILKEIFKELLNYLGVFWFPISLTAAIVIIYNFYNKNKATNKTITIIAGGILLTLIASFFGRFPIESRLCLFIYPLISLLFFYGIERLYSKNRFINIIIPLVSLLILLVSTTGIIDYRKKTNAYRYNQEVNFAVDFIEKNIKPDDNLYIYKHSIPTFSYKNKYKSSFGKYNNRIILGQGLFSQEGIYDIDIVTQNSPIYILTSHIYPANYHRIKPLIDSLSNRGELKIVYDKYATNVYYYTNKAEVFKDTTQFNHTGLATTKE